MAVATLLFVFNRDSGTVKKFLCLAGVETYSFVYFGGAIDFFPNGISCYVSATFAEIRRFLGLILGMVVPVSISMRINCCK